jgi:hypothetical protein
MAKPNPDKGLVPDISELYKCNPAEWQREAQCRTETDAAAQKLEEVESSLGKESAGGDAECENMQQGIEGKVCVMPTPTTVPSHCREAQGERGLQWRQTTCRMEGNIR